MIEIVFNSKLSGFIPHLSCQSEGRSALARSHHAQLSHCMHARAPQKRISQPPASAEHTGGADARGLGEEARERERESGGGRAKVGKLLGSPSVAVVGRLPSSFEL